MNPNDNPIFLTQKRLVYRGGVLAAILIAALVGLSLLSGLIAYLADPINFPSLKSPQETGKIFYGWTIGVETLVLVLGGFSRISTVLANERKAGLWDSNRLTPLKPRQLVIGYWFGSPLREFYMGAVLAGIGLVIVLLAKLPITFWLGTQILIFSTALFFGLLAALIGMTIQRPQGGVILFVLFIFFQSIFSFSMPKFVLTNFLLPVYGIVNLFSGNDFSNSGYPMRESPMHEWRGLPEIFGFHVYPIVLSLGLQLIVGIFLWRAAIRKTANPFQSPLPRRETVALFAILLIAQHGLIWSNWRGHFPDAKYEVEYEPLLAIVHGGTLLLAAIVLAVVSPKPESVRVKALRLGLKTPGALFFDSAVVMALVLAAVAAIALLTQFAGSIMGSWKIYLIAAGNLLDFFLIFSLLLESCRLSYKRRALGFAALWLFILCVLPLILAGVFMNSDICRFSLVSPGCVALGGPNDENLNCLLGIVAAHFGIAVLLFIGWRRQWERLLAKM